MEVMNRDYIMEDSGGYQYNSEFKPDFVKNGDKYHGYKTNNQEAILYFFAVQGYDLTFSYNGEKYYFISTQDYVARTDQNFSTDLEVFPDANKMIKSFRIDGRPLLELIDLLEDVDIL